MNTYDGQDDWLEGVRRWYFGGTPGPDDEGLLGAEPDAATVGTVASSFTEAMTVGQVPG